MPSFFPSRYHKFSLYLRRQFGCRVQKIPLNAGFSCPNRDSSLGKDGCIYCGAQGAGGELGQHSLSLRRQMLEGIGNTLKGHPDCKFIAYFQAFSNTYAPVETLDRLYREALGVDPRVIGLAVGTRPDCLSDGIWELLADYARRYYFWLELGLQSAHNKTLRLIGRGHDRQQFTQAVQRAHVLGLRVCAHVILGLPGEGRREILRTARYLNALGVEGVKIHNLYVLEGTKLAQLHRQGLYQPLSRDEYVRLATDFLSHLSPQIVIQRLAADPPHSLLLAPPWAMKKSLVLTAIEGELLRRDSWQGKETD